MPAPLALTGFLLFLGLGVWISRAGGPSRRLAINALLIYTIAFSGVVVATQKDAWPFTTYVLAAFMPRAERPVCRIVFRGVDRRMREWEIDPFTWAPVPLSSMERWYKETFEKYSDAKKDDALGFMLMKANAARARLHRGERIGHDRWLGFFAARQWWLFRRYPEVPPDPYVALRIYRSCWRPIDRPRGIAPEETLLASKSAGRNASIK